MHVAKATNQIRCCFSLICSSDIFKVIHHYELHGLYLLKFYKRTASIVNNKALANGESGHGERYNTVIIT